MPQNWKTYQLDEFADINPSIKLNKGEVYPFIEMKDLSSDNKYVSPSQHRTAKGGARFSDGDTLFARITPCLQNGKICQVSNLNTKVGFGSTEFLVFRGKQGISDSDFVFYLTRSNQFRRFSEGKMIGTSGRQRVSKDAYSNLLLELPPLQEQKAIASILSAIDDKIENNLAMNKTLEEMAMALYKHWFVDFGPFQHQEFIDSELGSIPKGWEVRKLGELYKTSSGGTPSRKKNEYYENGVIPWVKSKELYGTFVISTEERITELGLSGSSAKLIPAKSVLLAMYGATVGETSILSIEATCNQAICSIQTISISYSYVFLFLRNYKTEILNQAVGSAQQNISQAIIKELKLVSPPKDLEVFGELESLLEMMEQNLIENQTLTQLRDSLLPKLISGEVRVKDVGQTIANAL